LEKEGDAMARFFMTAILVFVGSILPFGATALAQGDGCPDSGDAGTTTPTLRVFKSNNTCEVTEGKAVLQWGSYRVDFEATASGYCDVYIGYPSCPWSERQIRNLSASNILEKTPSGTVYSVRVVQPTNGTIQYYNTVGPVNTAQTSPSWLPFYVGWYSIMDLTNVNVTACNFTPGTYPAQHINVYSASGFHRGAACSGGSIVNGTQLGESDGTGRFHYHGDDLVGFVDTAGVNEWLIETIKDVGNRWYQIHPSGPRMATGDTSKAGGGSWSPNHQCHQNGLEVDVRYLKNSGEGPLDLITDPSTYSKALTIQLLQEYVGTGRVRRIYVDPAADITATDVPGVEIDNGPNRTHRNHFHVELNDPDGADSNNCY
jgi:penicillin-insensitive murein endopeptidase